MGKNISLEEAADRITRFYLEKKRMPTNSEVAQLFGYVSRNSGNYLVNKLVEKGYFEKDETGRIIPKEEKIPFKLLGSVQAGWPSPAEEELVDVISLDEYLVPHKDSSYLLRVTGDSMVGAGIFPGSVAIVDRGMKPEPGDIVIAQVDGQFTMKFYEKRSKEILLVAANPKYQPIKPKEELIIIGVVVSWFTVPKRRR